MISLSTGTVEIQISLPGEFNDRITGLLDPFVSHSSFTSPFIFNVEISPGQFSLDNFNKRASLCYRETNDLEFELRSPVFSLFLSLEKQNGLLRITETADSKSSIIFNSVKWLLTYITIHQGGIPLHSALIASETEGILFSGASGTGKSTLARIVTSPGIRLRLGSDELNLVLPEENGYFTIPTPFSSTGEASQFVDRKIMKKVFFLRHASQNSVRMLQSKESFHNILKNTYTMTGTRYFSDLLMDSSAKFAATVPCGILNFRNDRSIRTFLHNEWESDHAPVL